jgi:hypothetical protein
VVLLLLVDIAGRKGLSLLLLLLLLLLLVLLLLYCFGWLQHKRLHLLTRGYRPGAASSCKAVLSLLLPLLVLQVLVTSAGVVVYR